VAIAPPREEPLNGSVRAQDVLRVSSFDELVHSDRPPAQLVAPRDEAKRHGNRKAGSACEVLGRPSGGEFPDVGVDR
jgi:hypothetical protein